MLGEKLKNTSPAFVLLEAFPAFSKLLSLSENNIFHYLQHAGNYLATKWPPIVQGLHAGLYQPISLHCHINSQKQHITVSYLEEKLHSEVGKLLWRPQASAGGSGAQILIKISNSKCKSQHFLRNASQHGPLYTHITEPSESGLYKGQEDTLQGKKSCIDLHGLDDLTDLLVFNFCDSQREQLPSEQLPGTAALLCCPLKKGDLHL